MVAVNISPVAPGSPERGAPERRRLGIYWLAVFVGAVALLSVGPAPADEPAAEQSLFITVGNPITSTEFARVQRLTEEARRRYQEAAKKEAKPGRLKIVYDFNPDDLPSASSLFGPCQDLAAYLRGLPSDIVSIAFVHRDTSRHTVLPVLACREIVMAPGDLVHLGNVAVDEADPLPDAAAQPQRFYDDRRVRYYRELAKQHGSEGVVLKMLDKSLQVVKGKRQDGSDCYVNPLWAKDQDATTVSTDVMVPAGNLGFYTAAQTRQFGLSKATLETRRDVKDWFEMPDSSLREDPLEGRTPKAFRIVIGGQFTQQMIEAVQHRLRRSVGQGANFLILQLECGGGDQALAFKLAHFILDLKDNSGQHPVMTVAYVTVQAGDYALFPALACNDIVMEKNAKLGDFERLLAEPEGKGPAPPNAELLGKSLASLATKRDYPPLVIRGMVERDLVVYHLRSKKNPERRFVDTENFPRDQWDGTEVKPRGQLLVLDPAQAKQFGISRQTVENSGQLYPVYGLEESQVRLVGPDWFEEFAGFLRKRAVAAILVMLGITCLILELKIPGVGLPGIISALCFVLFFWAHAQLAFTWLAVLLFLMGLVLIALEIFLFPGTAVLGVSGVLLVLAGLGLATMERWPQTESDWIDTAGSLGRFGLAFVGAVLAAIVAARYLPSIPYANRLVLVPPDPAGGTGEEHAAVEPSPYAGLLGAIGVAATTLRPSGMVRFGEEYVDVVAEGSYVETGARVQVIEIEGNRVVVKEV